MRLDVVFGPHALVGADLNARVVVVIDVLRASTTITVALANGARSIIPMESSDEAVMRAKSFERGEITLAGERKMLAIPGFELGNSPRQFSREAVEGKTILFTTTNGTSALLAAQGAREVLVGSFVNASAVVTVIRAALRGESDVTILCAGNDRHFSLEDATCAGRLVRAALRDRVAATINDGARVALLADKTYGSKLDRLWNDAQHARALAEAGLGEDLAVCGDVDRHPVVPVFHERQITLLGPDWRA